MSQGIAPGAEAALGRIFDRIAQALALLGGVTLAAVALMSVGSIGGRALSGFGLGPILGDFELVQVGCAVAVFSFLPLCVMRRGNVTVDIVVDLFPNRLRAFFSLVGDAAIVAAAWLIASRLWLGMLDKRSYGEETFILGMPVWWGYAASMAGAGFFLVVAVYAFWRGLNAMLRGAREAGGAHL
ncbi:MAG: TRAP transporter small permease [Pikeienuella sp.]|uniref:TRAP transporter small permease n=1 Tax=Pikeienuella sp. TaxID=2831957 RepID=UPI00391A1EEB